MCKYLLIKLIKKLSVLVLSDVGVPKNDETVNMTTYNQIWSHIMNPSDHLGSPFARGFYILKLYFNYSLAEVLDPRIGVCGCPDIHPDKEHFHMKTRLLFHLCEQKIFHFTEAQRSGNTWKSVASTHPWNQPIILLSFLCFTGLNFDWLTKCSV